MRQPTPVATLHAEFNNVNIAIEKLTLRRPTRAVVVRLAQLGDRAGVLARRIASHEVDTEDDATRARRLEVLQIVDRTLAALHTADQAATYYPPDQERSSS